MSNILKAFINIANSYTMDIANITYGNNRMNNMGEGLEAYIKNAFADCLYETDENIINEKISKTFSYTGNKTNPPDMMLYQSDAIEVKKIESLGAGLQLNSSYPKSKLMATNSKINKTCRECEIWGEKDLLYTIGYTKSKKLYSLWMIYGDCYAASKDTYEKVEQSITAAMDSLGDLELNKTTNELSGVRNVDPLGITYLRVRGMWIIENPNKVFKYLYKYDKNASFQMVALMKNSKYESMPQKDKEVIEEMNNVVVKDVRLKNPDNPANLIDAKILVFKV